MEEERRHGRREKAYHTNTRNCGLHTARRLVFRYRLNRATSDLVAALSPSISPAQPSTRV